jgi:ribosome-associated toxin RatA of RatAB toxin-antitoxin module
VHSSSAIWIRAPRERIFETVSQLLRWPEFLPHYRFVSVLGHSSGSGNWGTNLHMSAVGGLFPVSWKASYWTDPDALELHFEHLAAFTKGMRVVWTLTPEADGTRVEIHHELKFRIRALRPILEPILQHGFIEPVATRTLTTFKRILEEHP